MSETREIKPDSVPYIAAYSGKSAAIDEKSTAGVAAPNKHISNEQVTPETREENTGFVIDTVRQRNDKCNRPRVWITTEKASALSGIPERTLRDQAAKGKFTVRTGEKDSLGRGDYEILIDSLPELAQARYYIDLRKAYGDGPAAPLQIDSDELDRLWAKFYAASKKLQNRATNAAAAVKAFNRLLDSGVPTMQAYESIKAEYGICRITLNTYRETCERFDRKDWAALLLPTYRGKPPRLDWHPEAWAFFMKEALTPRAKVDIAYRRTVEEGKRQGWPQLPNIKTARKAIKDLPDTVRVLVKEGETALKKLAPTVIRDYPKNLS